MDQLGIGLVKFLRGYLRRPGCKWAFGTTFLLLLALPAQAQDSAERAGEVRAVIPSGQILRGTASPISAARGAPVFWEDRIRTDRRGRARIGLLDGSVLNIGSESELRILQHSAQGQRSDLELTYGRIRASVVRLSQPGSKFEVRTPVATAGVIGTLFVMRVLGDTVEMLCLDGAVRIRNTNPAIPGEQTVRAGQILRVRRGQPPEPPRQATPEEIRNALEETGIPTPGVEWSRLEISAPPAGCGESFGLLVRAWEQKQQDDKPVQLPVDGELISGWLDLGTRRVWVEGGHAFLPGGLPASATEGTFVPLGGERPVPVKIWPPLQEIALAGEGWRAPRANVRGNVFYVLGPLGSALRVEFQVGGQTAMLLWAGPCGAGFLAPGVPPGEHEAVLVVSGQPIAQGKMNVVDIAYKLPNPPNILRGQTATVTTSIAGLERLAEHTAGRPVFIITFTNRTPDIIGDLKTKTPGGSADGNAVTFQVDRRNIRSDGSAQLEFTVRGRRRGDFALGVDARLDPALEKPITPLVPAGSGSAR